jgi:hypothetical protein
VPVRQRVVELELAADVLAALRLRLDAELLAVLADEQLGVELDRDPVRLLALRAEGRDDTFAGVATSASCADAGGSGPFITTSTTRWTSARVRTLSPCSPSDPASPSPRPFFVTW